MRRRVTIGFLSIVCLLFFSGMVSFVELSHLSRDTGEILKANKRNIELAKEMLDAAYEQNVALIRLSVFGDNSYDSLCRSSMERLENTLLVVFRRLVYLHHRFINLQYRETGRAKAANRTHQTTAVARQ